LKKAHVTAQPRNLRVEYSGAVYDFPMDFSFLWVDPSQGNCIGVKYSNFCALWKMRIERAAAYDSDKRTADCPAHRSRNPIREPMKPQRIGAAEPQPNSLRQEHRRDAMTAREEVSERC